MSKIKVTPKQATEFMALGYEVDCYVNINELSTQRPKKPRGIIVAQTAKIGLSLEGNPPTKGNYAKVWEKLSKVLWPGNNPLATYSREKVEVEIVKAGLSDPSFFSYLLNKTKCIRVVE